MTAQGLTSLVRAFVAHSRRRTGRSDGRAVAAPDLLIERTRAHDVQLIGVLHAGLSVIE